jgi:hypothetical protein
LVQAASSGLVGNAIAELLKFSGVEVANSLVLLSRHNHGDVAVLTANYDRLTLGRVQQGGEALLGLGSRDASHASIIDKTAILVNLDNLLNKNGTQDFKTPVSRFVLIRPRANTTSFDFAKGLASESLCSAQDDSVGTDW